MQKITVDGRQFNALKIETQSAPILLIQGESGFLGCGWFSIETAESLSEAVAVVRGVQNVADMLEARVAAVSPAAADRGVRAGMTGKQALPYLN